MLCFLHAYLAYVSVTVGDEPWYDFMVAPAMPTYRSTEINYFRYVTPYDYVQNRFLPGKLYIYIYIYIFVTALSSGLHSSDTLVLCCSTRMAGEGYEVKIRMVWKTTVAAGYQLLNGEAGDIRQIYRYFGASRARVSEADWSYLVWDRPQPHDSLARGGRRVQPR